MKVLDKAAGVTPALTDAWAETTVLYQDYSEDNPQWMEDLLNVLPAVTVTPDPRDNSPAVTIHGNIDEAAHHISDLLGRGASRETIIAPFKNSVIGDVIDEIFDCSPLLSQSKPKLVAAN